MEVIAGILGVSIAVALLLAGVLRPALRNNRQDAQRRKRFTLPETDQRLPLAEPAPASGPDSSDLPSSDDARQRSGLWTVDPVPAPPVSGAAEPIGRLVSTSEGERVLTRPPFKAKGTILGGRGSRYLNRLAAKLPVWVVACPKVRLESLVDPVNPDGHDARDFAVWRRRVRLRSIDILLCDRRGHQPLLAIMFSRSAKRGNPFEPTVDARRPGGGEDRIMDEVLHAIGLPMLRVSGRFADDWHIIQPYVEQSILPSVSEDRIDDSHAGDLSAPLPGPGGRISTGGAVRLLRADGEQGWLLE